MATMATTSQVKTNETSANCTPAIIGFNAQSGSSVTGAVYVIKT